VEEAKRILTRIQEGKKARAVTLSDMQTLCGPYTLKSSKALVDMLDLPPFEIKSDLVVRRYNVGKAMPVIKAIPQTEKIQQALQAIDREDNIELLARWDDYGYATYEQLKLMSAIIEAKNNFKLVQATVDWIDKVEFKVDSVVQPFNDTQEVTMVRFWCIPKTHRTA
jgi:hypothetical protein